MEELKSAATIKNYIRNSNVNIFDFINSAIMVAASDHPHEFQTKKDKIAQTLFSCHGQFMNSDDEIEQVLKLKEILDGSDDSEAVLLDSLLKLQWRVKSVNVLKVTGVGKSVNPLRNHASKDVAQISRTLVKEWKGMVDEWLKDRNESMQQEIKLCGESVQNPPTPENQSIQHRPLIVRIKLKKDDPKVDKVLKITPVLDDESVSDHQTLKKVVENKSSFVRSTLKETPGIRVLGSEEDTGRRVNSGNLKKRLLSDDGNEEKLNKAIQKLKKSYVEDENMKKKRRIQMLSFDEVNSLGRFPTQNKPLIKNQIRRRW